MPKKAKNLPNILKRLEIYFSIYVANKLSIKSKQGSKPITQDQIIPILLLAQNGNLESNPYLNLLNNLKDPRATDRLCELAMVEPENYPLAKPIAIANNYAPINPVNRKCFYYLTGQHTLPKEQFGDFVREVISCQYHIPQFFIKLERLGQQLNQSVIQELTKADVLAKNLHRDFLTTALLEVQTNGPKADFYRRKLNNLTDREAINELCDLVILEPEKYPLAKQIAIANNYSPRGEYNLESPATWLFYYLTEQMENCSSGVNDALSIDRYRTRDVLRRVATLGRKLGHSEIVKELLAAKNKLKKPQIVAGEEKQLFDSLVSQADWQQLWQLMGEWSPIWSKLALEKLASVSWQPAKVAESIELEKLHNLVRQCSNNPTFNYCTFLQQNSLPPLVAPKQKNPYRLHYDLTLGEPGVVVEFYKETRELKLYDVKTDQIIWKIKLEKQEARFQGFSFTISPDGNFFCCRETLYFGFSYDSQNSLDILRIYDTKTGKLLDSITCDKFSPTLLAFLAGNRLLVYGDKRSEAEEYSPTRYNLTSGQLSVDFKLLPESSFARYMISPDGLFMAGVGPAQTVWVQSIEEKQYLAIQESKASDFVIGHLCFSPDSLYLAYLTMEDIRIIDIQSGELLRTIPVENYYSSCFLKFSPDGQMLISGKFGIEKNYLVLWRVSDGQALQEIPMDYGCPKDILFNYDGKKILMLTVDRNIVIYEEGLQKLVERPLAQNNPADLAWLEDRLARPDLPEDEQAWLKFTVALQKYRWRHEVLVDESPQSQAAPTDIELEG